MKYLFTLILVLAFISSPFTFSQSVQNKADSSQKISELKSKIADVLDSIKEKVNAKVTEQKPIIKTIVVNHYSVKEKIVYRDTCLSHEVTKFNVAPIHDTIEIKSDTVFLKTVKWYQFKKLREERKLKNSMNTDSTKSQN